jgi:hypothetical protein
MVWENEKSEDANLERLRHTFGLENITQTKVLDSMPTTDDMKEGTYRQVMDGENLVLVTKCGGNLYKLPWELIP